MVIINDSSEPDNLFQTEVIDIYKVYSVKNVINYNYVNLSAWNIQTIANSNTNPEKVYLAIDTFFENAFSHWVFESAIYLPLYTLLKTKNTNLKLHLKSKKTYKLLFCKYFNISDDDIVYEFDRNCQSLVYFPSPINSLTINILHPDYVKHLDSFWDVFRMKDVELKEEYPISVLPRQSKENYPNNNRIILFEKIIKHVEKIPNHIILHTDAVDDLNDQINIIRQSNTIVLVDGAAFQVNGMFSYNKNIIISGPMASENQAVHHIKLNYILKKIRAQNKSILFIPHEEVVCRQIDTFINSI